jgi:hypothetical protein
LGLPYLFCVLCQVSRLLGRPGWYQYGTRQLRPPPRELS